MKLTLYPKNTPDPNDAITIEITPPVSDADGAICQVLIHGASPISPIHGIDPIHVMECSLAFVRAFLAKQRSPLYWENGTQYESLDDE
jgi:hypothetical protein